MKKLIYILPLALCFVACNLEKNVAKNADTKDNTTTASASSQLPSAPAPASGNAQEILGSFVGAFGDNKIRLLITKVGDGAISGRSIVGGNDRPFDGSFTVENGIYNVIGREPGDHKDDGIFRFSVDQAEPNKVNGTWKANDAKRPEKSYSLARREFKYRTDVGNWPEASQRLLKPADVENLVKSELEFMRNEIFARHGYCFNKKHLRQQFENDDWYVPNTVDIKGYLTDIEKKNIALIKRYEKYADEYGDEFGR
ncbi:MAG: YARHG domain-containing protein [Pyrinomonadaceae bacterium]